MVIDLQIKYVGNGEEQNGLQMTGLNLMDKTLAVRGARIAFSIWDVAGNPGNINLAISPLVGLVQMPNFQPFLMSFSGGMGAGDSQFLDHVPIACKDAVAILYMFDLTSRCTLNKLVFRSVSHHHRLRANYGYIEIFVTWYLLMVFISLLQYYRLVREGKEME